MEGYLAAGDLDLTRKEVDEIDSAGREAASLRAAIIRPKQWQLVVKAAAGAALLGVGLWTAVHR